MSVGRSASESKVWGHPNPLEQVVLNLLSNARDTVDDRAEMEGVGYDKRIQIRTRGENDVVVIEVEDNGVGMDEATRQRLFEPFFTTKDADRGTGLGLSIIYAIIRNHDGQITVESEPGVGTMFRVMLPVLERDLPSAGQVLFLVEIIEAGRFNQQQARLASPYRASSPSATRA